jgi:hypothetical protein
MLVPSVHLGGTDLDHTGILEVRRERTGRRTGSGPVVDEMPRALIAGGAALANLRRVQIRCQGGARNQGADCQRKECDASIQSKSIKQHFVFPSHLQSPVIDSFARTGQARLRTQLR